MRISSWPQFLAGLPELLEGPGSAMTVGVFDGVHRGHQALIRLILGRPLIPLIVSFRNSPKGRPEIYSLERKLELFEELGVRRTVLIDFSPDFSKLGGRDFMRLLRERGKLRYLAVGSNFRCGYGLDTDAAAIRALGEGAFETEVLPPLLYRGDPVSSSRVRAALLAKRFEEAEALLGRAFTPQGAAE